MLTLTRPEKALMVASLCISHPELQPTMNTPITRELAKSSLDVSLPVLRLLDNNDTLISLLTLINGGK
jgi:hypothetical protein